VSFPLVNHRRWLPVAGSTGSTELKARTQAPTETMTTPSCRGRAAARSSHARSPRTSGQDIDTTETAIPVIAPDPYAHSITVHALPNKPLIDQGAGYAGAGVTSLRCVLACPSGPLPLAARGLAAVLARAGPAGGGDRCGRRQCAWWLCSPVFDSAAPAEIPYSTTTLSPSAAADIRP
jgi:hypothetical protein